MLTWREVGQGVYARRHEELNLNCGLVVGEERALLVDTRIYHSQGMELLASVRELTDLEVVVVLDQDTVLDDAFDGASRSASACT